MRTRSATKYSANWKEIAKQRKIEEKFRCERCKHIHQPRKGYTLTVHHLDGNKANNAKWNLAVLCQRCHLYMQGTVIMQQMLFDFVQVSDWFKPHLRGYKKTLEGGGA